MQEMKYLLGSGRFNVKSNWDSIWHHNTMDADVYPANMVVVEVGSTDPKNYPNRINLRGNLGHVGELINGSKSHEFCGWSAAFMQLAMTAYCAELDFIYKEQDCLAFGPWVAQMYQDMGDGNMVFGGKMKSPPYMPAAQSLVLIRHSFIPHFIWRYIGMGRDGNLNSLPEGKFGNMLESEPHHFRRLSFGYDRERPIRYEDRVWYAQKITQEELVEIKKRGLL